MRKTFFLAATVAAIVLGTGASSALAAERPSFEDQLAARLGISGDQLRAAVKATLTARIDAAVKDGRLTKDQGDRLKQRIADGKGFGLGPGLGRKGKGPGAGLGFGRFGDRIAKHAGRPGPAATYLGMTREALWAELQKGTSLAQVAGDKGKSVDGLVAAMVTPAKEGLAKAVESKRITQARANEILARLTERTKDLVQKTFPAKKR